MLPSIVIVDDEIEVLKALKRVLADNYQVITFTDAKEAISHFKASPSHIVISDLMMPGINGAELLSEIAKINSKTKRVALTGYASAELAEQAINEGKISLYLTKPWDNIELKEKLAILLNDLKLENKKQQFTNQLGLANQKLLLEQQSHLLVHNLMLDEQQSHAKELAQLKSSMNELLLLNTNLIALYSGENKGHSLRIAQHARAIMQKITQDKKACVEVYFAGLFHRLGMMSIDKTLQTSHWQNLTVQQQLDYYAYAQVSADIMSTTSMLSGSSTIVQHIFERVDGKGVPNKLTKDHIPLGARILRVVIDYDLLINGLLKTEMLTPNQAISEIESHVDSIYDREVVNAFSNILLAPSGHGSIQLAKIMSSLEEGMTLAQDLYDNLQHKLLSKETLLSQAAVDKLQDIQHQQDAPLLAYIYSDK